MRLPARLLSLAGVGRRLGRAQSILVVALAGVVLALGVATGSSHRATKRPPRPAEPAQGASSGPVRWGTASLRRMAARRPRRGGAAYYRRTARNRVSPMAVAEFLPLYREAERVYGVSWRLIASIHRQETAFSTAPSTYHGLNPFGCCAGPMQFNVTNGPVSTWKSYRNAFRAGRRPERYPHRTRSHPSVYDDFDAIMAAGSLLSDSGAGGWLGAGAWSAAYDYYGHDLFGVTYASQVLARAEAWRRDGFCANCGLDYGLVAEFDSAFGAPVRLQLVGERRRKQRRRGRDGKGADGARRRPKRGDDGADERARQRAPADIPPPSKTPSATFDRPAKRSPARPPRAGTAPTTPAPPPPAPPPPSTPPPTPPPPPADQCDAIRKLLGC